MAQAFLEGRTTGNYTIGGIRFWFNRDIDTTTSPVQREGHKDLGNVVTATDEQGVDILDHFSTASGTRRKDRSLVREITDEILLTLDELHAENLRMFFRAGTVTEVPASALNAAGPDVMKLDGFETRIVNGWNSSSIVVKDITDAVTYTINVDYEEVTVIGGYTGVRRKVGGAIGDGDLVLVRYDYDVRAHKQIAPGTELEVQGQAMFFAVSDTGNEFTRTIALVQLEPEGGFELDDEDWSQIQIRMKILDNSDAVAAAPFGTLEHYGTGTDL